MGKQVTPAPRDRAWRKDYRFPSRSSTVRHVSTPMSPWGYFCPPTPLTTPLKHETPPATFEHCPAGLGGENQPLWNARPSHEACHFALEVVPLFSEMPNPSQPLLCTRVSPASSGPHCSSTRATRPTGPGEVTLIRPPCTDTSMQSLLCTTWTESQGLAALGDKQPGSLSIP